MAEETKVPIVFLPKEVETAEPVNIPKRVKADTYLNLGDFTAVQNGAVVAAHSFTGTRQEFAAAWFGVSQSWHNPQRRQDRFPTVVSAKRKGAWECHFEGDTPPDGSPVGPVVMPDGKLHPNHLEACPADEAIGTVRADGLVVFK